MPRSFKQMPGEERRRGAFCRMLGVFEFGVAVAFILGGTQACDPQPSPAAYLESHIILPGLEGKTKSASSVDVSISDSGDLHLIARVLDARDNVPRSRSLFHYLGTTHGGEWEWEGGA